MRVGCFLIALLSGNKNLVLTEEHWLLQAFTTIIIIHYSFTSIKAVCMHLW